MEPERFLVDPSLLLRRESLDLLPDVMDALGEAYVAYIPQSFWNLLTEDGPETDLASHFEALKTRVQGERRGEETPKWNIYTVYAVSEPERAAEPDAIRSTLEELDIRPTQFAEPEAETFPGDLSGAAVYDDLPYTADDIRRDIPFEGQRLSA